MTIGILPKRAAQVASAVDVAIVTDMGQARNNIIVLSADVVIACGVDGAGTASEVSLAIKNGKQVVLLDANETAGAFFDGIGRDQVRHASSPAQAIEMIRSIVN